MKALKIIITIILLTLLCCSMSVSAATYTGNCGASGSNLKYTLNTDTYTLTITGSGNMKDFASEGAPWHAYRESIKRVEINKGVTSIGSNAFQWCTNLWDFSMQYGITRIGYNAFNDCRKLTSLVFPESITTIEDNAFAWCRTLNTVYMPEDLTTVGRAAFAQCPAIETVYADSVESWCKINFASDNSSPLYSDIATLYIDYEKVTDLTIPEGTTEIKPYAFYNCTSLKSLTIPKSVTKISWNSFSGCSNLKSVYADSIESWCKINFQHQPLANAYANLYINGTLATDIVIPNNITTINENVFYRCNSIKSVTIPKSITTIDTDALASCNNLKDIFYYGTEADWNNISINSTGLSGSNINFIGENGVIRSNSYISGKTCYYNLTLEGSSTLKGKLIIAAYNSKGTLVGSTITDADLSQGSISKSVNFQFTDTPVSYRLMLWDNTNNIVPLCGHTKGYFDL